MQAKPISRYIIAYDADCGPCTRFAHVVDFLDRYEKIDFISLTRADQQGLLDKISVPLRYRSFHLISPNGETKSGSEAIIELVGILPGSKIISPIINYIPGCKSIVASIYNRLSKQHDRGSCHISSHINNNIDSNNSDNK